MTVYTWGVPYSVVKRERIDAHTYEAPHGEKIELVYNFETKEPLSLRQAEAIYGQIIASPTVRENARIQYVKIEQMAASPQKGKMIVQFEAQSPVILSKVVLAIIVACIAAAAIAFTVFIVAPFLAAGYKLTTAILQMPSPVALILLPVILLGSAYVFVRFIMPRIRKGGGGG